MATSIRVAADTTVWSCSARAAVVRTRSSPARRCRTSRGESLRRASDFAESWFAGTRLAGASLVGTEFYRAHLAGADLSGADATGACFVRADLDGADLRGAVLDGADLVRAELYGTDARGARLRGARILGASLLDTDLRGADLSGAELRENTFRRPPPPGRSGLGRLAPLPGSHGERHRPLGTTPSGP